MPQASSSEVYKAIDQELQYQHAAFGENPHEIDAFATYIRQYSRIMDETATSPNTKHVKLTVMRKIAAIAVQCMQQHGAPTRWTSGSGLGQENKTHENETHENETHHDDDHPQVA